MKRWVAIAVALCAAVILVNCGGGGSTLPPERPMVSVSGVAYDGPIVGGTVSAYVFDSGVRGELIARATTDSGGFFGLDINTHAGPLLVEVSGGSYVEEASGVLVNLAAEQKLRTLINHRPDRSHSIAITYFTNLAAGLAAHMIAQGKDAALSIDEANSLLSSFAAVDIVTTEPLNVNAQQSPDGELTAGLRYGFQAAGISQWTREINEQQSLAPHVLYTSFQFAQLAYDDIVTDGVLDGTGARGQLALGPVPLTRDTYVRDIPLAIARFSQSQRNATGISAGQVFTSVAPAAGSAALFGGGEVPFIDGSTPQIDNVSLSEGQLVSGAFTLSASAFDAVGIKTVTFTLDAKQIAQFGPDQVVEYVLNTADLVDGAHQLTITATNELDSQAQLKINFNVSNIDFSFGKVTPPANSLVAKSFLMTVPLSNPADVTSAKVTLENGEAVPIENLRAPKVVIDSTLLDEGSRQFTVTALLVDGVEKSLKLKYIVDNTAPDLAVSGFVDGAIVSGKLRWGALASDANGIDRTELWVAGKKSGNWPGATKLEETLDTAKINDGSVTAKVVVHDKAGNTTEAAYKQTVDNSAPTITISQPNNDAVVSGDSTVTGRITDKIGVASAKIAVGSGSNSALDGLPDFSWKWDTRGYPDGPLAIEVSATDDAGHSSSQTVQVIVDNNPPAVEMRSPRGGDVINQNFKFSAKATDASGISAVTFYLGDLDYPAPAPKKPEIDVDISKVPDAVYPVRVEVKDGNGTTTTTQPFAVTIDVTPPALDIASTYGYDEADSSCVLTLSANDNLSGITDIALNKTSLGARSGTWQQNVRVARNEQSVIEFSGTDLAGNTATMSRCIAHQSSLLAPDQCEACP